MYNGTSAENIEDLVESLADYSVSAGEWINVRSIDDNYEGGGSVGVENEGNPKKVKHGRGKQGFLDGSVYEGDYVDGLPHGSGVYMFQDGTKYTGEFSNGEIHGNGRCEYVHGDIYEGKFMDGDRSGR